MSDKAFSPFILTFFRVLPKILFTPGGYNKLFFPRCLQDIYEVQGLWNYEQYYHTLCEVFESTCTLANNV